MKLIDLSDTMLIKGGLILRIETEDIVTLYSILEKLRANPNVDSLQTLLVPEEKF